MEVTEMRTLSPEELKSKLKQRREELFRSRFKAQSSEARDTSVVKKLRHEIARTLTVLSEKQRGVVVASKPVERPENEAKTSDKPAKKRAAKKKE